MNQSQRFESEVKPYWSKKAEPVQQSAYAGSYPLLRPTDVPESRSSYYLAQQWVKRLDRETWPAVPK